MKKAFNKSIMRSLDTKSRLMLPQEYRDVILSTSDAGLFVLTSFYGRIVAYSIGDWEKKVEQFSTIKFPSMSLSHFMSKVLGLAEQMTCDKQGRIRITQPLIRAAGLKKDIVIVGLGSKFEIWDQEIFESLELEDVSAELAASGVEISL